MRFSYFYDTNLDEEQQKLFDLMEEEFKVSLEANLIKGFKFPCKAGKAVLIENLDETPYTRLSTIQMIGNGISGHVGLFMSDEVMLGVINATFKESYDTVPDELADCISEVLNVVFGHAREQINKKSDLDILLDVVPTNRFIIKDEFQSYMVFPRIMIPIESDAGRFSLQISLEDGSSSF